jgi:hypothetical protein
VYYCDYSLDKGMIFIKQASFIKLLKDAQIINATITDNDVNLMLSKELNNPSIKSTVDFQSFLNMLVKIALLL